MNPEISVIVPVFNGEDTIAACIEALLRSEGVVYEIIVVDDQSTDGTTKIVSRYPVTLITLQQRIGGGGARNPGAAKARASLLLHTDADVEVAPDTLRKILWAFEKDPSIDALFGAYSQNCPQSNFISRYKNLHHHHVHQISRTRTNTFWSGCGAIRKEVFQALGGFRSTYFLYDIDLGYRLAQAGYKIVIAPHIQVRHHKNYTFMGWIRSDLYGRAIPWTQIMLEHKIFNNNMNTRLTDTVSVAFVCLSLGCLFWPMPVFFKAIGFFGGLVGASVLHPSWIKRSYQYGGLSFAIRTTAMEWIYYLICGIGAITGTIRHFKDRVSNRIRNGKA